VHSEANINTSLERSFIAGCMNVRVLHLHVAIFSVQGGRTFPHTA